MGFEMWYERALSTVLDNGLSRTFQEWLNPVIGALSNTIPQSHVAISYFHFTSINHFSSLGPAILGTLFDLKIP